MIRLVALLGNPGNQYRRTRHNAAWLLVDECSLYEGLGWQSKFHGSFATVTAPDATVRFLRPETYMNRSGQSVAAAMGFFNVEPDELLVVHDEVELPFGTVSFKFGGGTAGHNGLRSVRQSIGTGDFYRFRLGVSRPSHGDVASYVLARFSPDEEGRLPDYLSGACALLTTFLDTPDQSSEVERGRIVIIEE